MKKDKIVIYTNKNCPYCKQVKEGLTEKNIKFTNKLTAEHKDEWQNIVDLTKMATVPTIQYKNNYFVAGRDFGSLEHVIDLVDNFNESTFPVDRQLLELTKTLNYNISMAFQRTDQLLRQIEQNYKELFEDEETKTE